jgi:hypothetical protein
MTEVEVCLEFACRACGGSIELTVRCEGELLALTTKVLARTRIYCPNCGEKIDVTFDPDGVVYDVAACNDRLRQPSLN